MITTQAQTYTRPSFIQPSYSVNGVSVSSDKTGEPSHRYIFDIYVDGSKVGRLKTLPAFNTYSSVEISDIVKNYVENQYIHQLPKPTANDEDNTTTALYGVIRTYGDLIKIKVLAGEEYKVGGVLTTFNGNDVVGEPEVRVSEWFSTYQAMDANSVQTLVGRGGITNNQFQANHMDVLEYVNKAVNNTFDWNNVPSRYTSNGNGFATIYNNYSIKPLSNAPLDRTKILETPGSIGYYEGNHITMWDKINQLDEYDQRYSTYGRRYDMDPFDMEPQYTGDYNVYRQRLQTIGYDYYDPSGLAVGEIRYQPTSPVFGHPINDGFGVNLTSTDSGVKVSEFTHTNIETGLEYSRFEKNTSTDFIRLTEDVDYGDFRDFTGDLNTYIGPDRLTLNNRPSVRYKKEDEVCDYTPPSYLTMNNPTWTNQPLTLIEEGAGSYSYEWVERGWRSGEFDSQPQVFTFTPDPAYPEQRIFWDFLVIPDKMQIIENGVVLLDTGFVNSTGAFEFTSTHPTFDVVIETNNTGTAWYFQREQKELLPTGPKDYLMPGITPNNLYRVNWTFDDTITEKMEILDGGNVIYDTGATTGSGFHIFKATTPDIVLRFYRTNANTEYEYILYEVDVPIEMLEANVQIKPPMAGPFLNEYKVARTMTFSSFVKTPSFNNLGYYKNFVAPSVYFPTSPEIPSGEHFYIPNTDYLSEDVGVIVGVENTKNERLFDRYKFHIAPCLYVYNKTEGRWCNKNEIMRLTGRSLNGDNIGEYGYNIRPAIEVLDAKVLGEYEPNIDKNISMTFRTNQLNTYQYELHLGIFTGLNFQGMGGLDYQFDRFRLVYGNDVPLRNANNYKLNVYDFDNNFNLIPDSVANGGKFTYNFNNIYPTSYLTSVGAYTPSWMSYWDYGVQGNDFGDLGQYNGYLNNQFYQRILSARIQNISTTPGEFTLLQTADISSEWETSVDTYTMSYIVGNNEPRQLTNNYAVGDMIAQYGSDADINIEVSCMIRVEKQPEDVDFTYIGFDTIANGSGIVERQSIYRAQDMGRWKRIYLIASVPNTAFNEGAGYNLLNYFKLKLYTNLSTDSGVWNGQYIAVDDFRYTFIFEENNASKIETQAHKVFSKSLLKLNEGREPHYTLSGDMLRNEAYSLFWLNPYGAWDDYRFKGRSIKTTEVGRTQRGIGLDKTGNLNGGTFVNNKQNYGDRIDYQLKAYETYELTSDYLNDEEREWMEELFTSPKHYLYDEGSKGFIRVNLLDKEYTTIKKNNQKLYQLKIEIQVSAERRTLQVLGKL